MRERGPVKLYSIAILHGYRIELAWIAAEQVSERETRNCRNQRASGLSPNEGSSGVQEPNIVGFVHRTPLSTMRGSWLLVAVAEGIDVHRQYRMNWGMDGRPRVTRSEALERGLRCWPSLAVARHPCSWMGRTITSSTPSSTGSDRSNRSGLVYHRSRWHPDFRGPTTESILRFPSTAAAATSPRSTAR